ncbi:uncharacterized protein LOC132307349 [Cornus florida]|uniref:uncharacterized protein LOC132307349 n=1 Tax=Cornus florida TaxID=4283 RepID=UPI00289EFC73|nr:uncharacterized protein LOC132307349 [Cornus florida]
MGCCLSTTNKPSSAPHSHRHSSRSEKPSRAPPPPPLEEETVKEVLSETPTRKPPVPKFEDEDEKTTAKHNNVDKNPPLMTTEDISEVSEICSFSETVSTTTFTDKRDDEDDDGEVRQRVVNRSPAKFRNRSFTGDVPARKERLVGKSPTRKSEASPGRVRPVISKDRRGLVTKGQRRVSGDNPGRRSRSPATRTDVGGKRSGVGEMPSARKSPDRVRSEMSGKIQKVEESGREGPTSTTSESLENPLVSLECFIFL